MFIEEEPNFRVSNTSFKKRELPALSAEEIELKAENNRQIQRGIIVLRKLRTSALREVEQEVQYHSLSEAHEISTHMAEEILRQACSQNPIPVEDSFKEIMKKKEEEYVHIPAESGYILPPQLSVKNLVEATEDILIRIEEKVQSLENPTRKLTKDEMLSVLDQFLSNANHLPRIARKNIFDQDTKIGTILSGGSVYGEIVKKLVQQYADPQLSFETFVIAVDKKSEKAISEINARDPRTKLIVLVDDVINEGGTLLAALPTVGEHFPNAQISSGVGIDEPGDFDKRQRTKHQEQIGLWFQDFAELTEEGKKEEAVALFNSAEQFAKNHNLELQPGWYIGKKRLGL